MSRSHLFVLLVIWVLGIFIGWNYESFLPYLTERGAINAQFEMKPMLGMQPNVVGLFINNLLVGSMLVLSGWLSAGSLSCIISLWNAFLIGMLLKTAATLGISKLLILNKIIWHGSLEIVGLIIFGAIGLQGFTVINAILNNKPITFPFKEIRKYAFIATTILFAAAVVEDLVI